MMIRLFAVALVAMAFALPAYADAITDCAAMLPFGAPVYRTAPAHHTELCHAPAYVLSHDNDAHEPRWVAWQVTAAHLAMPHLARTNDFRPDPALPTGAGSTLADYDHSGYDRGHMSDAEDNAWSAATDEASFLLSNMIPQCAPCNRSQWLHVENWTRDQARKRGEVFVLAGPVLPPNPKTIGPDHVWVPVASWRLVVDPVGKLAWGFIVPNDAASLAKGADVAPYQVTPAQVLTAAGIDVVLPEGIDRGAKLPLR